MKYIKNFEKLIPSYLPREILINILLKNKYWKITGKKDVYYWKILSPNKSSKIYHSDNISVVTLNFNTNTVEEHILNLGILMTSLEDKKNENTQFKPLTQKEIKYFEIKISEYKYNL